jgi:crotonobetainyl-CoA:carnitine CoA-transferase CaiB-like acyl-CoA transferase
MADWAVVFKELDLVWGPVPPSSEVAHDPQLECNRVFAEIEPGLKTIQNPMNVDGVEKLPPRMPPKMGEHTCEVLHHAGFSPEQIARIVKRGEAL